ncbi:MAG TPA: hypothetical protein VLZ75_08850, partial [Chitinophagales bacterium]|nr:hypothetical protein [Chitinophagales bacterium]
EKKYNVTVDSFFLKANPYKQYEREEVPEDLFARIQLSLMEGQKSMLVILSRVLIKSSFRQAEK